MCYLYKKLRAFLEREKVNPKDLKGVIFFIYSRVKYIFGPNKYINFSF